ncbi:hypothetical protein JZL84_25465, partial [Escherichia coli]|nr:hypothetical protein [Escherichia coli]
GCNPAYSKSIHTWLRFGEIMRGSLRAMLASFTLAGCQSNADDHAADVYQTDQLNTKQETKTVNIISALLNKSNFC